MAAPSTELDETDEDFFDRLMNDDEVDCGKPDSGVPVEGTVSDEAKVCSNLASDPLGEKPEHVSSSLPLSISSGVEGEDSDEAKAIFEVTDGGAGARLTNFGEKAEDGSKSVPLEANEDIVAAEEISSLTFTDVNESSERPGDESTSISNESFAGTVMKGAHGSPVIADVDHSSGFDVEFFVEFFSELGADSGQWFSNVEKMHTELGSRLAVKGEDSAQATVFSCLNMVEVGSTRVDSGREDIDFDKRAENCSGSLPSLVSSDVKGVDSDEVSSFSQTMDEVGSTAVISEGKGVSFGEKVEDGSKLLPSESNEVSMVAKESNSLMSADVNESTESASVSNTSHLCMGMKEVQWGLFATNVNGSSEFDSEIFSELGDGMLHPLPNAESKHNSGVDFFGATCVSDHSAVHLGSSVYLEDHVDQYHGHESEQNAGGLNLKSSQDWENLYPGWRYDPNTGQWYQLENYQENAANSWETTSVKMDSPSIEAVSNQELDAYSSQKDYSFTGNIPEEGKDPIITNWNNISQGEVDHSTHMVFDPQYPGWYYDTIAQEWRTIQAYDPVMNQSSSAGYNQQYQAESSENYLSEGINAQHGVADWGNHYKENTNMLSGHSTSDTRKSVCSETKQHDTLLCPTDHADNLVGKLTGLEISELVNQPDEFSSFYSSVPTQYNTQHSDQRYSEPSQQMQFTPGHINKPLQHVTLFSSASNERSSAGRPPHTLVTFGFGGKLIVTRGNSLPHVTLAYGNQDSAKRVVNVHNLLDIVMDNTNSSSFPMGARGHFAILCQQSFPGPLVGGNVGKRELNRWVDERIADSESSGMDFGREVRLLLSLLKIACQYYGKLRSPFGIDQKLTESDYPEAAVAKLFSSLKASGMKLTGDSAFSYCLQNLPSEAQSQATAFDVQKLLLSGRKKEALECAKEGHLWGLALILASQLGYQVYGETLKQMAVKNFRAGSPLQTLCLLIAGATASAITNDSLPGYADTLNHPGQIGSYMLDEWEENLAMITANRIKDDEVIIVNIGDCLWKSRGEVNAAHICYLLAEADFEPYSDSARLCLIGADHRRFPRTYANPDAIQRTELYEYSKVLGNSQSLLLSFQPYKLVYAYMLAEVGIVADSLKYCQAISKSLKSARAPDVDSWKQLVLSLEERLRIHQQGGYNTNLVPAKLMGKLRTYFDSTTNHAVGGLPPAVPATSHHSVQHNGFASQQEGVKESISQSTMPAQSLVPSASMEPITDFTGQINHLLMPSRSISEPVFSRSPSEADAPSQTNSSETQDKSEISSGSSRFGRFRSQLFQKTLGLVMRPRSHRQAKLGEANRFYYDEKLKRWVEEGAEPPSEEAALPPPPTTAAFQKAPSDYTSQDTANLENFHQRTDSKSKSPSNFGPSSGVPQIPTSLTQFSAHAHTGVRSRYVDTFNKSGGNPVNLFQRPSAPSIKPNLKFFIPAPVTPAENTVQHSVDSTEETALTTNNLGTSLTDVSSPPTATVAPDL